MSFSQRLIRAVTDEDFEVVKALAESSRSLNSKDYQGNTALHIAVTKNNFKIVTYLLEQKKIINNGTNFFGETPLFLAVRSGNLEIVESLLEQNIDVNVPNSTGVTPLHVSLPFPRITKLLLEKGVQVDVTDLNGETPLHYAVMNNNLESIYTLLCYNADANAISNTHQTPFFKAIQHQHEDIVEILLDYVPDFNDYLDSFLSFVIVFETRCHYIEAIIEKGAKVDYLSFDASLESGNPKIFKIILNNIPPEDIEKHFSFYKFLDLVPRCTLNQYLEILIDNPKMKVLVGCVARKLFFLIEKLSDIIPEDLMIKLLLTLITYGYQLSQIDIHSIFYCYGYTELLRMLLYVDYEGKFNAITLTPRLIFEVTTSVDTIIRDCMTCRRGWIRNDFKKDLECFFEYCCAPALIPIYTSQHFESPKVLIVSKLPRVPTLVELARNKTREHIISQKGFTKASQYYTYIMHIPLSHVYKRILMFQTKLYKVEFGMSKYTKARTC